MAIKSWDSTQTNTNPFNPYSSNYGSQNVAIAAAKQNEQKQLKTALAQTRDVATLKAALRDKKISRNDFLTRFQQIAPTVKPQGVQFSSGNKAKDIVGSIGTSTKNLAKGVVSGEQTAATGIARVLPGGTNDLEAIKRSSQADTVATATLTALHKNGKISNAQFKYGMANAANNANNTGYDLADSKTTLPSKKQLAAGFASTGLDILTAGTLPELKAAANLPKAVKVAAKGGGYAATGAANAAAVGGDKKQILENAALGTALPLAFKGGSKLVQKNFAPTKELITNVKTADALSKATKGSKLSHVGNTAIKETNTKRIPVVAPTEAPSARIRVGSVAINNADRTSVPVKSYGTTEGIGVHTPVRPGIKEVSSTSKINVRTPDRMTEEQFNKKYNQLGKDYDQATKNLETSSANTHPDIVQAKQTAIDEGHKKELDSLLRQYDNPKLTKPVKPQLLERSTTKAGKATGGLQKPLKYTQTKPTAQSIISRKKPVETSVTTTESKPIQVTTPGTKIAPGVSTKPITVTKPTVEAGELAPSGSALKTQAAAVESGFKEEFPDIAKYRTGSYKQESENASRLVNEDPVEAKQIAMGHKSGNNTIHEKMVYTAVKNKARAEGDGETLAELSSSMHHTKTSEEAQGLGATGYNADGNDPVRHIRVVKDERVKAFEKRTGKKLSAETMGVVRAAKSEIKAPTKDEWHSFVESLKC